MTRGEPTHKLLVTRFLADSGTLTRRRGIRKFFFISFLKYGGDVVFTKKNVNFTKFITHKSFDTNFIIILGMTAYPYTTCFTHFQHHTTNFMIQFTSLTRKKGVDSKGKPR